MRTELLSKIMSLLPVDLANRHAELGNFYDILCDYPNRTGKGIRSELLLRTAKVFSIDAKNNTQTWDSALWLATALELFQNWVLIHDDIEDDSDERRGKPALHRLYGMPLALNAGDALHAYMWEAVFNANVAAARQEFLNIVHRTAEGQHLDLAWVEHNIWDIDESDYLQMIQLKTAYYTVNAPLRLGFLVAGRLPSNDLLTASLSLGMAFQIRDDVLNLVGEADKYGKEIAGDLYEGKRTLIALHWLDSAPEYQREIFLSEMLKPRLKKSSDNINKIHNWLINSDSIRYAQEQADYYAAEGLALLKNIFSDIADNQQEVLAILSTMRQLATREA